MKKFKTKKNITKGFIAALVLFVIFFTGCYEFKVINQPDEAYINSFFDVPIIVKEDGGGNDFTGPDLQDLGLFGVLIPDGWTVKDSIHYNIISADSAYDINGVLQYAPENYSNEGFLIHDDANSTMLEDSIPSPDGYYWWGAITDREADMSFFDSLYITPRIITNDVAGTFYLRYAIGDKNYWDRYPADDVSDPLPITIIDNSGVEELLSDVNTSIFPNPAINDLHINFNDYRSQVINMQIIDAKGNVVLAKKLYNSKNNINISNLAKGLYFVNLQNGKNYFKNYKIIVK